MKEKTARPGGERFRVTFLPSGRSVTVRAGTSLLEAARGAGLHLNASCGGSGLCGKCRVRLEEGGVDKGESEALGPEAYRAGYRQACTSRVVGPATIRVPAESGQDQGGLASEVPSRHRARMHVYNLDSLRQEGLFKPPVEKFFLELPRASQTDNSADASRVIQGMADQYGERHMVMSLAVLQKVPAVLRRDDFRVTVTLARPVRSGKNHLLDVQAGNWSRRNFGLAFDIGTTTVYGVLIDLNSGRELARAGAYNRQLSYGEDVITRIIQAEKPQGRALMQKLVVATINALISRLLARAEPRQDREKGKITPEEIASVTMAGNTTMTHLLLGLDPSHIRRAPYVPVTTFLPPIRAADLGIELPPHAVALLFPAISSYVGGDIVAGVMGSGMYRTKELSLYVDIGTNAEIVIGNRDWLVCAACSAGPAFEGGGITHGMRAAQGAIVDFSINPQTLEPMNITIGNRPPLGIAGSGLLLAVARLFEQGVIDQQGRFRRGLASDRIRPGRHGWEYVLAWQRESGTDHDIVLTEVDIENFIRAKAAIYAGITTLLAEVGLAVTDLERIILAGGFGSFVDLDAAMTVGLLPEVEPERIVYVGNGSLMGAWMSEVSNHIRQHVVAVVQRMTRFELSEVAAFKDQYIGSHFLPHTDLSLFPGVRHRLEKNIAQSGG